MLPEEPAVRLWAAQPLARDSLIPIALDVSDSQAGPFATEGEMARRSRVDCASERAMGFVALDRRNTKGLQANHL
jgi:hypothetical protein